MARLASCCVLRDMRLLEDGQRDEKVWGYAVTQPMLYRFLKLLPIRACDLLDLVFGPIRLATVKHRLILFVLATRVHQ